MATKSTSLTSKKMNNKINSKNEIYNQGRAYQAKKNKIDKKINKQLKNKNDRLARENAELRDRLDQTTHKKVRPGKEYATTVKIGEQELQIKAPTRGTMKKLVKELARSTTFSKKPASVRNVEKITNGIIALESIQQAAEAQGYTNEALKLKTMAAMWEDFLETCEENPDLAEVLANALNRPTGSVDVSEPNGDIEVSI